MGIPTKLADLHDFISCPLCHGYLIDATTVTECLHTFCKSCIVKYLKNNNNDCPKCNTIIHERRPLDYIIFDRSKQDIVYKLVPQLYITELSRKCAVQELPDIDSLTKKVLKQNFIYVILVQKKRNFPIELILSQEKTDRIDPANKQCQNRIYLKCPLDIRVSHLRKLLAVKYQLDANDRITLSYKGDIVSDPDQVSNLAQAVTFYLHYEISKVTITASTSSYESASTSSGSIGATTMTISTSTDDNSDQMSIDE